MSRTAQLRQPVADDSQIGEARRAAQRLAQQQGFDEAGAGRVALAATELAKNLLRHGGGGELLIQPIPASPLPLVELLAIDRGNGMDNIERCLRDGYSTAGTPGTGLGAVRRAAQEFDVYSAPGEGTVLMARIAAQGLPAVLEGRRFGSVCLPMQGEQECGDGWVLVQDAHSGITALAVVDGLGHGALAAAAARAVLHAFDRDAFAAPQDLLHRMHAAARGSRGAAGACAQLRADGSLTFAGIGNIGARVAWPAGSQGLVSHPGILGVQASHIHPLTCQRPADALLIMHTDGISARMDLAARAGLLARHPAVVAGVIYRDCARPRDDVTVVVVGS